MNGSEAMADQTIGLDVENLTVAYGHVRACHQVTFSVRTGSCLVILGPNGAGKSSLLKGIAGAAPVREGRARLSGRDLFAVPGYKRPGLGLSLVPEALHLFPQLTVSETLTLAGEHGRPGRFDTAAVLELFPTLTRRLRSHSGNLSGGERQMLGIARALMLNPSVMLLDEPSSGLAPAVVEEVGESIKQLLAVDLAIVLVEQNVGLARSLADEVILLHDGITGERGGRELLANEALLRESYFGE